MDRNDRWRTFGWRHELWELVRYYRSLRRGGDAWLTELRRTRSLDTGDGSSFPVDAEVLDALAEYVLAVKKDFDAAFGALRDEDQARECCERIGVTVGVTSTKSADHHQSSKALVAGVSGVASAECRQRKIGVETDPQRRAVWLTDKGLHVSARNLDGVIPGLGNPKAVWEIKEYWGKTSGGSKMSDAVYECQLVGRELREFEEKAKVRIQHIVFVDGRDQWGSRKSDLVRFIDLFHQGIIDELFVGKECETEWRTWLREFLDSTALR